MEPREPQQIRKMTRRKLFGTLAVAVPAGLLAACGGANTQPVPKTARELATLTPIPPTLTSQSQGEPVTEMPKKDDLLASKLVLNRVPKVVYSTNVTKNQISTFKFSRPSNIDRGYLTELLSQLQQEVIPGEDRTSQVINNLSLFTGVGTATALMIDDSGIFISCSHSFRSAALAPGSTPEKPKFTFKDKGSPAQVILGSLRKRYPILEYLADDEHDIAIIYAPTGYRRRRADGIQIRAQDLREQEELWQTSLYTSGDSLQLQVMYGLVTSPIKNIELNDKSEYKNMVGIADMIPFGGSSGSPILDASGKVVAIESGSYAKPGRVLNGSHTQDDYAGSIVTPLTSLREIIVNGIIRKVPV